MLPYHVFRVLCALAVLGAIFASSMLGWFVIAVGCAAAEWYTRTRDVGWPADIQDLLHRMGAAPEPVAHRPQSVAAVIPFRPLTVQDIFLGAFKVVARNWPTLVGIPAVILIGFVVFAGVVFYLLLTVFSEVLAPLVGGAVLSGLESGSAVAFVTVIMLGYFALVTAIALPADALLLSTSVIATDKAVRGERVGIVDVFTAARHRIFAVCRLTLVFYGICFLPDVILTFAVLTLGLGSAFMLIVFACFVGSFVVGILFSLAPIVLVVEKRGVADSLRRSMQLVKPAWARLLGIHLLWAVGATALMMLSWVPVAVLGDAAVVIALPYLVAFPLMISYFRTVQMLIYTDLRIRQESYEHELLADWTRNTQFTS